MVQNLSPKAVIQLVKKLPVFMEREGL